MFLQIRMLTVAAQMLEEEKEQKVSERDVALTERVPPLNLSGLSLQELQVFHLIQYFPSILSFISTSTCGGHVIF